MRYYDFVLFKIFSSFKYYVLSLLSCFNSSPSGMGVCRNWVPDVVSNPGWCFGTPAAEKVSQSLKDVAGFMSHHEIP